MKVAIVGLGYVGLPLSLRFARSGASVLGLDIDFAKVEAINAGRSYIRHIPSEDVAEQTGAGRLVATTDFSRVSDVDAVIICAPTPLNKNREPDISFILDTGRTIAPHLPKGVLVALESTTYPGTTDQDLRGVLEKGSGFTAGVDFHLAFSPEREDPANPDSKVGEVPKLVGGMTQKCLEKAVSVYGQAIKNLVPVDSCRVAEAAKLLENIFRGVNIALVNELKLVYAAMGFDVWEVIEAAKTKPFGFMAFYPGPGLGGHCIPIDPFYLTWKAREFGHSTRFIELAGEINTSMPNYLIERATEALNSVRKAISGSRVLVLGLAYKPNVDDERESPSYRIIDLLTSRGAVVDYHDPHVPEIRPTREHPHWADTRSVEWSRETLSAYDAVLVATAHAAVGGACGTLIIVSSGISWSRWWRRSNHHGRRSRSRIAQFQWAAGLYEPAAINHGQRGMGSHLNRGLGRTRGQRSMHCRSIQTEPSRQVCRWYFVLDRNLNVDLLGGSSRACGYGVGQRLRTLRLSLEPMACRVRRLAETRASRDSVKNQLALR